MRWYVLFGGLVLGACSSPKLIDTGRVAIVSTDAMPAPTRGDLSTGQRVHLVGPFDKLGIEVFGLPEMARTVQVDANGQFAYPMVGVIDAAGKTPMEISDILQDRLRDGFVRDPQVTVGVTETVSQTITVDGEVRMPGLYPALGKMTLMRAIARAQGTTEFAQTKHVVLFRTIDDRRMAALYDLRAIRLGAYEDPEIYPNDVVVVGESQARRIFPQIIQGAALLLTPLTTVISSNNN